MGLGKGNKRTITATGIQTDIKGSNDSWACLAGSQPLPQKQNCYIIDQGSSTNTSSLSHIHLLFPTASPCPHLHGQDHKQSGRPPQLQLDKPLSKVLLYSRVCSTDLGKKRLTGLSTVPTSHRYRLLILKSITAMSNSRRNQTPDMPANGNHTVIIPHLHKQLKKNTQQNSWKTLRMCCGNCCSYCLPTQGQGTNVGSDFSSLNNENNAFMNHKHRYSKISQQIQSLNQTGSLRTRRASYYRHRSPFLLSIKAHK